MEAPCFWPLIRPGAAPDQVSATRWSCRLSTRRSPPLTWWPWRCLAKLPWPSRRRTLIPRPAGLSRWSVARSLSHGGIFFAPQRELDLTERLRALAAGGRLQHEYDLVWCHQSLMAKPGLEGVSARTRVLDVDTVVARVMRSGAARPMEKGDRPATVKRAYAACTPPRPGARGAPGMGALPAPRRRVRERGRAARGAGGSATVIPNAVPAPDPVKAASASDLLFTGSLDYRPNIRAAETLVTSVLPLIRSRLSHRHADRGGKEPDGGRAHESATRSGSAWSPTPPRSALSIVALAYSRRCCPSVGGRSQGDRGDGARVPIVANPVAAEGLALVDGHNALIRDTDEAFAAGCVELLRDPSLAERMGLAGLDTWSEQHRPESVEASIKALLETARPPG